MEQKNYADALEGYLIAEEGIFGKLFGAKKVISQTKPVETNHYKEYYRFLDTVFAKIPPNEIAKEKALRKKEWSMVSAISKSATSLQKYDLEYFLNCSNGYIFEDYILELAMFDGYEELEQLWQIKENHQINQHEAEEFVAERSNKIELVWKKICNSIDSKTLKCFEDPHVSWDKYEGYLIVTAKPSAEFMEIARKYGYVSHETYFKNR